jgi:hypothetical protein
MSRKLDHALKEEVIEALKFHGTKQYASKVCNVSVKTITAEMNRSEIFKRRVNEAMVEGKANTADRAIELIKAYAFGEMLEVCPSCNGTGESNNPTKDGKPTKCKFCEGKGEILNKTDRNRLTAAIALANAYEPGFRGTTNVQGKIEHDVKVISAVPRPKYTVIENKPLKALDKGKDKGYNSVEEVIEGEVINE